MKRCDLQGVRGFAVILVLLFHLFPESFGNGFAGVDIFFVLSGHLMTMIYGREAKNPRFFVEFYKKRFVRLLPMYSLAVLVTLLVGTRILVNVDLQFLLSDVGFALPMLTNVASLFSAKDYFDMLDDYHFLLHTWSLAVEVQYYLVAPFVFWLEMKQTNFGSKIVNFLSFSSFLLASTTSGPLAFNFLLSRMWQFQLGAFSCRFRQKRHRLKAAVLKIVSSALLLSLLLPKSWIFGEKSIQTIASLSAAIFFAFSNENSFCIFSNRFFVFFGDISYILYLVHWPTILYLRYFTDSPSLSLEKSIFVAFLSVFLSYLTHINLEKPLLNRPLRSSAFYGFCTLTTVILFTFTSSSIDDRIKTADDSHYYWSTVTTVLPGWTNNEIMTNAVQRNSAWSLNGWMKPPGCLPREYPPLGCVITRKEGSLKVTVLGNSFAYRVFPAVYEVFKKQFSKIQLLGNVTWEPLERWHLECADCDKQIQTIYATKPDVLFIINRFAHSMTTPIKTHLDDDRPTQEALKELRRFAKAAKKIVISGLLPTFSQKTELWAMKLARRLFHAKSVDDLWEYSYQIYLDQHRHTLRRIDYLLAKCPKCSFFDLQAPFCDAQKRKCRLFDGKTLLSFYSDNIHLSYRGIEEIIPSLEDFARTQLR